MLMGDFNSRKGQLEFNLGAVPFTDSFVEEPVFQDVTVPHLLKNYTQWIRQQTNMVGL